MTRKFTPDMPVSERIALLEVALEKALKRYPMEIEPNQAGDLCVMVPDICRSRDYSEVEISLFSIARDIERLLS